MSQERRGGLLPHWKSARSDLLSKETDGGRRGAPEGRVGPLQPLSLSLEEWSRQHCGPLEVEAERYHISAGTTGSQAHRASRIEEQRVFLDVPATLRLPTTRRGGLDLQLDLFALQLGAPADGATAVLPAQTGSLRALNRAAGLLVARLLFPDALRPICRALVGAWCATALARAAVWVAPRGRRQRLAARVGELAHRAPAVKAAQRGLSVFGDLARAYGGPAAALALAAALWAWVHPTSEQIGRCIASLVPVMAGYAQTSRECAEGWYGEGMETEQAWHRRHKWAAQRVASLLSSLSPTPPLKPLLDAWDALDISIAMPVPGGPPGGWGLNGGSVCLGQRRQRRGGAAQQQPAEQPRRRRRRPQQLELPGSPAKQVPALGQAPAEVPPSPATPAPGQRGPCMQSSPSGSGPLGAAASTRSTPERCRFTPEQMARVRAYQESAMSLFGSPSAEPGKPAAAAAAAAAAGQRGNGRGRQRAAQRVQREWHAVAAVSKWLGLRPGTCVPDSACATATICSSRSSSGASSDCGSDSDYNSDRESDCGGSEASRAELGCQADTAEAAPRVPLGEAAAPLTILYGRADHLLDASPSLSLLERLRLGLRAVHLLCLFFPFLLLGPALLLLAACLPDERRRNGSSGNRAAGAAAPKPAPSADAEGGRAAAGSLTDTPVHGAGAAAGVEAGTGACSQPPPLPQRLRLLAFRLLLWACRGAGAAFIKWGQWSATREDIFPEDFCAALSELHDRAPQHSFRQTRREVLRALGRPVEEIFERFDPQPLASGSIAQVHRAVLRLGGRPVEVAVKVRHPGVARRIWADFQLLRPLAALTARVRSLKGLQLKDSIMQFSHTMTAQTDLRVEAEHLRRFSANFEAVGASVVVPRPVPGYCTESVLVESFEPGQSVAHYLRNPHPRNGEVVALGVDAYLQMLLRDNFVHTDLHPGNILVRTLPAPGDKAGVRERLQIVLLDFGLAEELTPSVRTHFISLLNMIAKGDGAQAAAHLLRWGARQQCPRPAEFAADVAALFERECDIRREAGIDLDGVMKAILHLARKHEVTIDSNFAALVVGICVLVGFATALDPRVNLMDAATPALLWYSLTGRMTGRLYM